MGRGAVRRAIENRRRQGKDDPLLQPMFGQRAIQNDVPNRRRRTQRLDQELALTENGAVPGDRAGGQVAVATRGETPSGRSPGERRAGCDLLHVERKSRVRHSRQNAPRVRGENPSLCGRRRGEEKPAPDVYNLAAKTLGVDPARCVVIEDTRIGMLAGKAAGMRVCVTKSIYSEDEDFAGADAVFDCIGDEGDERFSFSELSTPGAFW